LRDSDKSLEKLETIENDALRKIFGVTQSTSTAAIHLEAGLLPIRERLWGNMLRYAERLEYMKREEPDRLISQIASEPRSNKSTKRN
jgi:hypothetical protein